MPLRQTLALVTLMLAAASAPAQVFKDPAFHRLYEAERLAELEQLANQRLAARADDAQAVLAAALGALIADDAARRERVIGQAEACLRLTPQAAPCHYALGSVLGLQAMSQGITKMLGKVGQVKAALQQAVALEPQWYTARSALLQFYLAVPGFAGGGEAKAAEVARAAPRPEQAQALQARIAIKHDRFDAAVALLEQVRPGADPAVDEDLQSLWISAGIGMLGEGQRDKARALFQRLSTRHPDQAAGSYGLARVATEAGAYDEAVSLLQRCATLKGGDRLPLDYRLGIALQGAGRNDDARAAYQRFVASGKGARKSLEDARKRMATLA
jgi:Tfp pilus assembly protein PilF